MSDKICFSPYHLDAGRVCKVCGNCMDEDLVSTGEAPPKPIGYVVRSRYWHIWQCRTCKIVTVDKRQYVYDGDGEYALGGRGAHREVSLYDEAYNKFLLSDRPRFIANYLALDAAQIRKDELRDELIELEEYIYNLNELIYGDVAAAAMPVAEPVPSLSLESAAPEELVFNDEWKAAIDVILNGNEHVFVTGGAGVGKSTLLQHIVEKYNDAFAVLAPTGVAALRVGGQTIHSFFKFKAEAQHEDNIQQLSDDRRMKYKALKLLIIDEGSMIRADVMDGIDLFLRKNGCDETKAFGGVRLVIFGDLFQLPPVSKDSDEKKWLVSRYGVDTPYFFHAAVWRANPLKVIQLTTIFRQKDPQFTDALNAIRAGTVTDEHLALLNSRVQPHFTPPANELWITLTTTNAAADAVNRRMIDSLKTEGRIFKAEIFGDFNLKDAPTDELLELKVGATVMFIRNHPRGWWMNGTLGRVTSVNPLKVTLDGADNGLFVDEAEWESIVYEYDAKTKKLARHVKGSFTQVPLKVAAAITIHKSQSATLDRAIVDFGNGTFSPGQAYTALSRCRTLEGMVLRRSLTQRDIIVSLEVKKFFSGEQIAIGSET